MTAVIEIVPQIIKQLLESCITCKANFRFSNNKNQFDILNIERILMYIQDGNQIGFTFKILNNETTATIYIHKENIILMEIS